MIYVKSFLVGLAALILVALLGVGATFARVATSSSEAIGVVGPGLPIVAISLLAFAAGFFWQYRRSR